MTSDRNFKATARNRSGFLGTTYRRARLEIEQQLEWLSSPARRGGPASTTVESAWPLTAQVLRDHAKSLRAEGRYWDRKAEDEHDE